MSEHDEQCAVVKWFKMQYPKYKGCILAIPNGSVIAVGGWKDKHRFARLKWVESEGFKKGTSDLFIAVPAGDKHGLWIEMKNINKTLSSVTQEQLEHIELMREMGYAAEWCAGFDKAKTVIEDYMNETTNNGV